MNSLVGMVATGCYIKTQVDGKWYGQSSFTAARDQENPQMAHNAIGASLRYLQPLEKWEEVKPFQIIGRRAPDQPRDNLEFESHFVNIIDIRKVNFMPSLDTVGFQWIKGPTCESLGTEKSINDHIRKLETSLKDLLGARGVFTYQYQVRLTLHDS